MVDKNLEEAKYFFYGCENYLRRENNNFNWELIKLNIERYKPKNYFFSIIRKKKHKKSICFL
jgi:hypothetical protein